MKNQRIKSHIVWLAIISAMAILTSCGGDDPAKMEVINGISVPPEPDPVQNNATVAGVDANSNGVRDDVERTIAAAGATNYTGKLLTAKLQQAYLEKDSGKINLVNREIVCSKENIPIGTFNEIIGIVANTENRKSAYGERRDFDDIPEGC